MNSARHDFLIVGSGAGGATLARELALRGKSVLVLERGKEQERLGGTIAALCFYDGHPLTRMPRKSREGVILWRTFMAGGTTVVSCGNGIPCLEPELAAHGIDLRDALTEAERELGIVVPDPATLSPCARKVQEAARALGYSLEPTPKLIAPSKCSRCGRCVLGCSRDAKWTARRFLGEAQRNGARVVCGANVTGLIVEQGRARGVVAIQGRAERRYMADTVILAAGGLGTPVILRQAGVRDAGKGLFCDLLVNTYGLSGSPDIHMLREPPMSLYSREFRAEKGFIISTYINPSRLALWIELGLRALTVRAGGLLGIMTKIADDNSGEVFADGSVSKRATANDRKKLNEGSSICAEVLRRAGCAPRSILTSRIQGAHPGGTAAVGRVVDKDLQTPIANLFVCDASVLPTAPGMPPIVTIVALAKRLAATLAGAERDAR
jgi:choline dehydrogenase-like flavoprotein